MAVKDLMIAVKRWSSRGLLVLVVLFGLYTWLMLSWSYAKGERAGGGMSRNCQRKVGFARPRKVSWR